jgi:23S rRNA (uridine2552-2'-O)-methyltransferase
MSKRWFAEKKREHYYRLAKRENYRSRAAYKLKQIQFRFNVIHPGWLVVDLGASPGGWSQVAAELVDRRGMKGGVVAVDIARMKPIEGVTVLRGNMMETATVEAVRGALAGRNADVVISDMSPDISGTYSVDHARSVELSGTALEFAQKVLRPGGNFVVKVFQGELFPGFLRDVRQSFKNVRANRPPATRSQSSETYVVAKGFEPRRKEQGASAAGERSSPGRGGPGQSETVLPGRAREASAEASGPKRPLSLTVPGDGGREPGEAKAGTDEEE